MNPSDFLQAFIPLFVAIDAPGLIPVFFSLTQGYSEQERQVVAFQALATAFLVSALFLAVGEWIFRMLGISASDFQIGGGLLLVVFAVIEILQRGPRRLAAQMRPGPVPLGTPLLVGPAVLTSLWLLVPRFGYPVTIAALSANLVVSGLALHFSRHIRSAVNENGLRAISQVINLLLAAIGISLIRRGLETLFAR